MNETINKFSNDDLKKMQSWNLDKKIAVSLTRITEFYAKTGGASICKF